MRRLAATIAIVTLLANLGCTSVQSIRIGEVEDTERQILAAVYRDGRVVEFQEIVEPDTVSTDARTRSELRRHHHGTYDSQTQTIRGIAVDGQAMSIPVDSLATVRVRRNDGHRSVGTTLAIVGGIGLIAIVIWSLTSDAAFFD